MTEISNRTLYLTCDRDGCGNRRALAHGCSALELAEDRNAAKLRDAAAKAGWGIEPDGFVECPECAGSPIPLDETLAQRSRRGFYKPEKIFENKACP